MKTTRPTCFAGASRREFLRRAGALSMLGGASPLALNLAAFGTASAQAASDYRALVCVFLFGGNDAYNMVLATHSASWTNYLSVRNQAPDSIALRAPGTAPYPSAAAGTPDRLGEVLALNPINAQGRSFALHPLMGGARDLFAASRLAIVPNVGPLLRPTTKADYKNAAFPKPAKLLSHNDQQSTWQTNAPEGARTGWGGRIGDLLAGDNGHAIFTSVSASGNAVWLAGDSVLQDQVSSGGAIRIGAEGGSNGPFGSASGVTRMHTIMRTARGNDLLPETSIDQYGATLGRWFGVADGQLLSVFPNLAQFDAGKRNLGFML